jgi:hypothetical protein
MWVFSETGFVSAVVDPKDSNVMVVRSRDKKSIQPLADFAGTEIIELPNRDYEYRVFVERETFSDWVLRSISTMEYGNYKSRMYTTRGDEFTHSLSDVWSVMLNVSDKRKKAYKEPKGRRNKSYFPEDWYDAEHI